MIEFKRYKSDWPFSPTLNQFIIDNNYKYPFVINNELKTLDDIKDYYNKTGVYGISNENTDLTIYGNATVNLMFRAWHDSIHIQYNLPFTIDGELDVYNIMQGQLFHTSYFEKLLLYADVVGQSLYFNKHGKFVENQRDFVIDFISKGII